MKRDKSTALPTELPGRYERLFAWRLDRRCAAVREVAGDLAELWQDLGGVDQLSSQKRWLAERVVFMRRQMLAYETAILGGTVPTMDAGTYSNFANVVVGHLKTLGIERQTRATNGLRDYLARPKAGTGTTHG
jgi:hypothetical protein